MKALLLLLLCACSAAAAAQTSTLLDGVFSKAQVQRGKTAYLRSCQGCHSSNLQGEGIEPPLIGDLFIDAWREDKLFSLYDYVATRMPKEGRKTSPGSLTEQQYLDIVAYILDRNGFPAGTPELKSEQLSTVQFVGLDGPQPLPQSAMVRFVGCLVADGDKLQLTDATEPFRVRVSDETDEHEVAQSRAVVLGNTAVALTNVKQLDPAVDTGELAGQKVQAKGVLNLASGGYSLHVLSLVTTGAECPASR